jgi:hypothetical protein
MKITLEEEQVKEVVSAAVLKLFNEEQRDTLMKSAVAHLLTPTENNNRGYGRNAASPLEDAFLNAVDSATRKWFHERLTSPDEDTPEKKMLHDALSEVVQRMFTGDNRATVIDTLTEGVVEAFKKLHVRDY